MYGILSDNLPLVLLYCIGSTVQSLGIYFEIPGRGMLPTLPVNIFGHFSWDNCKMSHWNTYWTGDHGPVVHDGL